jgi:hypothetical protein
MLKKLLIPLGFLFIVNALIVLFYGNTTRYSIVALTRILQRSRGICAERLNTEQPTYTANGLPLLCIFTTFKPATHKIPIYTNTLYNWVHIDEQSRLIKPILYVTNNTFDNETLSALACRLGWEVLEAPRVSSHGVPYLKEMYSHTEQVFPGCAFYGYSNADILYTRGLVDTLTAVNKVHNKLGRILVVGQRTNTPCCDGLLYLPDDVTLAARRNGSLFRSDAEDYFFIASNVFPWERIRDVVIGRSAYDNYLVGMAIHHNVSVVDATNTLLAVHQTDKDGNFAGHSNKDGLFNHRIIGGFNYGSGLTSSAQFYSLSTEQTSLATVMVYRRINNTRISDT